VLSAPLVDARGSHQRGAEASGASKRPKLLIVAMGLMWLFGMTGSASGCSNMSFLRGSQELPDTIERLLAEAKAGDPPPNVGTTSSPPSEVPTQAPLPKLDVKHPLVRASLVREQARLTALGEHQRRAFPLALAQSMLGLLLVVASMALLTRKPGWRRFALQVIVANAALALGTFVALAPVRAAMANAAAEELVAHPIPSSTPLAADEALVVRRAEMSAADLQVLLLQLSVFGFAVFALNRPKTLSYLAQVDALAAQASERDTDTDADDP